MVTMINLILYGLWGSLEAQKTRDGDWPQSGQIEIPELERSQGIFEISAAEAAWASAQSGRMKFASSVLP